MQNERCFFAGVEFQCGCRVHDARVMTLSCCEHGLSDLDGLLMSVERYALACCFEDGSRIQGMVETCWKGDDL